jgi:hypothetical protein
MPTTRSSCASSGRWMPAASCPQQKPAPTGGLRGGGRSCSRRRKNGVTRVALGKLARELDSGGDLEALVGGSEPWILVTATVRSNGWR